MNLPAFALKRKTLTNFLVALIGVGGIWSYFQLGRLEDPDFTVKRAVIITQYPGANPAEVELEVTDRIEKAIQEMPQLDDLYSISRAGLSIVRVDMKQEFWADRLPQVWDEMRRKINDVTSEFPPGVMTPDIGDDFSFVYGFVLALTGDGYTYAELEEYAKSLRKELSTVEGVSRVELWGVQPKVIYLDISEAQLSGLGITVEDIIATLATQNMVVDSGGVEVPGRRFRIETTGDFADTEAIGDLIIRESLRDIGQAVTLEGELESRSLESVFPLARSRSQEVIRLRDIATVRQGYLEPPIMQMRFNGQTALAIQLANVAGGNILATGQAIEERLAELIPDLPLGIEVEKFAWQSDLVGESINGFVINLAEAVLIVLVVLTLAMGWRMGVIIGTGLILTILGTFIVMAMMGVQLQRVSLGALVIALGMMVDNAIVVADGISVRLGRGMKPEEAAVEAAQIPAFPLLGATIIAVIAFYPVFSAKADAGEYGQTLFTVVGISLMLSWLLSMTVTPIHCLALLKPPAGGSQDEDAYGGGFFRVYKRGLEAAIRFRVFTVLGMTVLLVASVIGFRGVPQQFFPDSTRAQFLIDFWAPEGTPIQDVSASLRVIEQRLDGDPRVKSIGTFIGAGGPRFYLPVDPEFPYPSYGQVVVNTPSFADVNPLVEELAPWVQEAFPGFLTRVRKYTVGPGETWPFELRITGPAVADLGTLRELGEQGMEILRASPLAKQVRTDMRQKVQKVVVDYDSKRARWSIVPRANVAQATRYGFDGYPVGLFRQGDDVLPIIARKTELERRRTASSLDVLQVRPVLGMESVPLSQVTRKLELEWEDPLITRWNRRRQVAVQASPNEVTFPTLRAAVIDQFEAMDLPPGFKLEWDGEYDSTRTAQLALVPGGVPALVVIAIILVALFNSLRPMVVLALVVPFALIGITAILLPTQTPFGFMALLGAMSLVGMMLKNGIVLIDEIRLNQAAGRSPYDATVRAGVTRVRPVVLAALTTVLGVAPLLQDAFWISMAMTIMAGLTVGTVLTMVLVPVLHTMVNRIPVPRRS
ncbi:MAG: efflux RND transporter permease subunit [Planctomycetota bacterium]|jgi:multidrug efflux pump subunit AcrB